MVFNVETQRQNTMGFDTYKYFIIVFFSLIAQERGSCANLLDMATPGFPENHGNMTISYYCIQVLPLLCPQLLPPKKGVLFSFKRKLSRQLCRYTFPVPMHFLLTQYGDIIKDLISNFIIFGNSTYLLLSEADSSKYR